VPLPEAAVAAIVAHMNDDHADAVLAYVHRFGSRPEAESARLVGVDETGMDIEATTGGVAHPVRIAFDHALADAADARDTLIAMAR
jgi:putative heme iron utilization protein